MLAYQFQPLNGDAGACMIEDVRNTFNNTPSNDVDGKAAIDLLDSLELRCTSINKDFKAVQLEVIKKGLNVLPDAAASLKSLIDFEVQYADTMQVMKVSNSNPLQLNASKSEERRAERAQEISDSKRSAVRVCFLQLVTAARRLVTSLPREDGNNNGALGCEWGMLGSLEERAVRDAEAEEESARTLTYLGIHWSELAINGHSASPLFGAGPLPSDKASGTKPSWVRDSWGTLAPSDLVHAEECLARSANVPGFKAPTLTIMHARRLEDHAKFLETQDQYDASAQRYREMAKLASEVGAHAVSAHALSQLSHSLKTHGSHEEAIVAAKKSVDLTMDPLAQFVLASSRLSSGLLTTDASLKAAEVQLRSVAGQLPTEELEVQRAKMHSEMRMWRWISTKDIYKCRLVGDAARLMICVIAKMIF